MLWQRKQGKNRDFVKEFSPGPPPFLRDYLTFSSGAVTRFFFIIIYLFSAIRPTIYFHIFSG